MEKGKKDIRREKLEGFVFDKLTVNTYISNSKYNCICECGNETIASSSDLKKGKVKSCGCLKKSKELDLVGKKFNMLTVVERLEKNEKSHYLFKCKCDCGIEKIVVGKELKRGKVKSCGNHTVEAVKKANTTHGMTNDRIYQIHRKMKTRCYKSSDISYDGYGGRGIKITDDWLGEDGFLNFFNWSIDNGYDESLSIDRIDVNGDYSPTNCRWATSKMQSNNKRNSFIIKYKNEEKTLEEWCSELNLDYDKIWKRLRKYNYSIEKAFEKQ